MPYCIMCGSRVSEEDMYCLRCGYPLKEEPRPLPQFGKPRAPVKAVTPPTPPPTPKKVIWTSSAVISIVIAVILMIIGWDSPLGWILYPVATVCGLYVVLTQKQDTVARLIGAVLAYVSFSVLILSLIFMVEVPTPLLSQVVPSEVLQVLLGGGGVIALIGGGVAWFMRRRRRGRVRTLLTKIESIYARRDEAGLYKFKDLVLKEFRDGKIDEGSYMILQERIDDHMEELPEQRRVPRCAECGRELSSRDKFCPYCGAPVAH